MTTITFRGITEKGTEFTPTQSDIEVGMANLSRTPFKEQLLVRYTAEEGSWYVSKNDVLEYMRENLKSQYVQFMSERRNRQVEMLGELAMAIYLILSDLPKGKRSTVNKVFRMATGKSVDEIVEIDRSKIS